MKDNTSHFVEIKPIDTAHSPFTKALQGIADRNPGLFHLLLIDSSDTKQAIFNFFYDIKVNKPWELTEINDGWGAFGDANHEKDFKLENETGKNIREALKVIAGAIANIEVHSRSTLEPLLRTLTVAPDSKDAIEAIASHIENAPAKVRQEEKQKAPAENLHASRAA